MIKLTDQQTAALEMDEFKKTIENSIWDFRDSHFQEYLTMRGGRTLVACIAQNITEAIKAWNTHPANNGARNGGKSMKHDPLEYIRNYYGVPAMKWKVVSYKGRLGTITGASGPHVKVRLEGEKHARPYHPTDLNYDVKAS